MAISHPISIVKSQLNLLEDCRTTCSSCVYNEGVNCLDCKYHNHVVQFIAGFRSPEHLLGRNCLNNLMNQ